MFGKEDNPWGERCLIWLDEKYIYLFIRENNGLNKYIFIVDFGERKIIIIKKYYYYY